MDNQYIPVDILREILSYNLLPRTSEINNIFCDIEKSLEHDRESYMNRSYPGWNLNNTLDRLAIQQMIEKGDIEALDLMLYSDMIYPEFIARKAIELNAPNVVIFLLDNNLATETLVQYTIYYQNSDILKLLRNNLEDSVFINVMNELGTANEPSIYWSIEYGIPYDKEFMILKMSKIDSIAAERILIFLER